MSQQTFQFLFSGSGIKTLISLVKLSHIFHGYLLRMRFGALRVYASMEEIIRRFRTIPEQDTLPFTQDYVASTSIREVSGGWTWKFDPNISRKGVLPESDLHQLVCRVAIFRAEHGLVPHEMAEVMNDKLGSLLPVTVIRDSGHAIMLDRPLELIDEIQKVLAQWA